MEVKDVLELLGNHGKYRFILCVALVVCNSTVAMNHLLMAVLGFTPSHSCKLPSGIIKDVAVPTVKTGGYEKCVFYENFNNSISNITLACNAGWDFAMENGASSVVTEWSLVCNKKYLVSTITTIYFAGVMVGGAIAGQMADRFGRKPIVLICMYCHIILGLIIYFVQSLEAFVALRFFVGFLMQGLQTTSYVLLVEMTAMKYRPIYAGIFEVSWAIGNLWMCSLAWLIQDWRKLQLALCLPSLITLIYIILLPESIRWLVLQTKTEKAENVIRKIASINKSELPENLDLYAINATTRKADGGIYSFHDLFRTPNIRKRTLLMGYTWLACSVGYYGLTLSVSGLAGDRFVNLFISAIVDLVAFTLTIFILKYFNRRMPLMLYFVLGGVTCIVSGSIKSSSFEDKAITSTILAIVGKFFISAAFSTIFLFTAELFPTVVRTIGMGSCVFWARVGGMIAPQINLLGNYTFNELPFLIFGILSLLAGIAIYFVPETSNAPFPDTIEAIEKENHKLLKEHQGFEGELTKL